MSNIFLLSQGSLENDLSTPIKVGRYANRYDVDGAALNSDISIWNLEEVVF